MNWRNLTYGLALCGLLPSCASLNPPEKIPPSPEKGLLADGFVPGPDGLPRGMPVVVEPLPHYPDAGPVLMTPAECQERASRAGRLNGESVAAWRLERKVAELGTIPPGCRFNLDKLREKLGLQLAGEVSANGTRIALLQHLNRLARLKLAVDRACWSMQLAIRAEEATPENTPARITAIACTEEARAHLAELIALTPDQAARLVLTPLGMPNLPANPAELLCAVVENHALVEIARLTEDTERRTKKLGLGDASTESRQLWLKSQQTVTDTEVRIADEGSRLLRRWQAARHLFDAWKASPGDRQAGIDAEREAGLAQIDLAHWLTPAMGCTPR